MKKQTFVNLLLGTVGGLLFSVGMCMCLLPQWNAFQPGVIVTALGAALLLVLGLAAWVCSGKKLRFNGKLIGKVAYGIAAALVFGVGMCMVLVWQIMLPGIALGVVGIVLLLCLIPMCVGFTK